MNEKKRLVKNDTINIMGELMNRFLPYWPVFVLSVVLCFSLAFLKLRYTVPLYKASATILLKDEETGMESVLNALEGKKSKKNVENEIEIIRSRKIMNEVVRKMGLYAQVFMPGRVNHLYAYNMSPVTFVAIDPDQIRSTDYVKFTYLPFEKAIELDNVKYQLEDTVNTPFGKFRLNYNNKHDVKDNQKYFVKFKKVDDMAKDVLGNLVIYPGSKQSTILNLNLTDPVPSRAEDILNTLIDVFNKAGVDDKNMTASNTLAFIEDRLAKVTLDISSIEGEIATYKERAGIVNISTEGTAFLNSVQKSDQELSEVKIQLSVLDQVERYVLNKSDLSGTVPATLGISDPILMQLLAKLNEAELQLGRLRKTSGENSPSVLALQSQIAQLKPSILENIRNLKQNLMATESKIQSESNRYSSLLRSIPQKERQLLDITRQQGVINNIYTFLLQKREETALSYASAAPDSRLINAAEALPFTVYPVKTSMYLFALLSGILLAVGFVMIKENYTKNVMFKSEIEKYTDATILSEIIFSKEKDVIVVNEGSRTPISEQFRTLRTSLGFLGDSKSKKTILLTSSVSGDGKSFIAINLAVSLAISNKKVLLMDLDLRKPKLSKMLDISNEHGISAFLNGTDTREKIIKKLKDVPNLHIITSGVVPPNPSELLMNGKLDKLMEELKQDYDFIILDTPPLGLVSDAKLLNSFTDISLYVVRHGNTPKRFLQFINQVYVNAEINNMYIVFNGLKDRGIIVSGNTYGSGYGSNYGYGYHDDHKPKTTLLQKFGIKPNKAKQ